MNNKYQQVTTRCSRSRETSPTPSISFTPPQKTEEQLRLNLDGGLPGSRSGGGGGGGRVGGGEKIGEEREGRGIRERKGARTGVDGGEVRRRVG